MNRLSNSPSTSSLRTSEGSSINATCRRTGIAKHTVLKLLKDLGCAAARCHNADVRNLRAVSSAKMKNIRAEKIEQGWSDVWTWTTTNADT